MSIDELLKFVTLTHKFQQIKRRVRSTGEEAYENDVEHSYQLAMAAWYLIQKDNLPLNVDKAVRYGLVHDLVEVHAGDTYLFEKDEAIKNSKHEREMLAAKQLKEEFPEFPDMHEFITAYEERADDEAKFIYALDKLLPTLNIYLDGGRTWKMNRITVDMIIEAKQDKIALSPVLVEYFKQILERIESNKQELMETNEEI